jgi:hypothetical protein
MKSATAGLGSRQRTLAVSISVTTVKGAAQMCNHVLLSSSAPNDPGPLTPKLKLLPCRSQHGKTAHISSLSKYEGGAALTCSPVFMVAP